MHRSTICEVFLTGFSEREPTMFAVDGEWPRAHPFYAPRHGVHDPMIVVESVRQIGALLAHGAYGVALDRHFVLDSLQADVRPVAMTGSATTVAYSVLTNPVHRRGQLARMSYTAEVDVAGERVARIAASFSCVSRAVYARMRRGVSATASALAREARPVPPAAVGRTDARDVLLLSAGASATVDDPGARRTRHWRLQVDPTHPFYFDHPLDHVPGMLLLEAARQAHTVAGRPEPGTIAVDARFHAFADLAAPAVLTCVPVESGVVVEVRQDERLTMTALLPDSPSRAMP